MPEEATETVESMIDSLLTTEGDEVEVSEGTTQPKDTGTTVDTQEAPDDPAQEEQATEDGEAEASTPTEDATEEDTKPSYEDLVTQLDRANKRQKDSEAEYTRIRQREIAIQAELEQVKAQTATEKAEPVFDIEAFRREIEEDPAEAMAKALETLAKQQSAKVDTDAVAEIAANKAYEAAMVADYERQEVQARKTYDDYDEVITEEFATRLSEDTSLQARWIESGRTAESAYAIAKAEKDAEVYLRDPEAFKAKIKEELRAEMAQGKTARPPRPTFGAPSKGAVKPEDNTVDYDDNDGLPSFIQ